MVINDVTSAPADLLRDFSCAVGIALTPENAPRTAASDTARQTSIAKLFYTRQGPFPIDRGPICQPAAEVADRYDYPSGHTTAGWTMATLLAEIKPGRATAMLARGRADGESRIVCGVHNAGAVEAGRPSATSTPTVIEGNPAFTADLAAALVAASITSGGNGCTAILERDRAAVTMA